MLKLQKECYYQWKEYRDGMLCLVDCEPISFSEAIFPTKATAKVRLKEMGLEEQAKRENWILCEIMVSPLETSTGTLIY